MKTEINLKSSSDSISQREIELLKQEYMETYKDTGFLTANICQAFEAGILAVCELFKIKIEKEEEN